MTKTGPTPARRISARAKLPSVVFATIHGGHISAWFHHSVMDLLLYDSTANRRVSGKMFEYSGANLSTARNRIAQRFLDEHPQAEWLWLIDTDMVFPPDTLDALLTNADPVRAPIVGALCFGMSDGRLFPTLYTFDVGGDGKALCGRYSDYPPNAMFQVAATGAACLLIHRSVLEAIKAKGGHDAYPWFQETEMSGTPVGEDITFCIRAGLLNFPIHVDTSVDIGHHKDQLLTADMFRAQRAADLAAQSTT